MDRELLIEIGVEELPAAWLPALTRQLAERVGARLTEYRIAPGAPIESFSTPRRLTAHVAKIAERQEDLEETISGPPVSAAFSPDGKPTPAGLGFAKKQGVPFEELSRVTTPKGEYLAFHKRQRGKSAVDTLPDLLSSVLRDLSFPKQMHWDAKLDDGRGELLFGRPIRWLLFLYGGRVVPFRIGRTPGAAGAQVLDVESGPLTYGHRFLATSGRAGRSIKVRSFDEYQARLSEHFVVLSHAERRDRIARELESHARRLGGRVHLKEHTALIEEVADLVEFPGVVAGFYDPGFLALPHEVLTTTLVHHQHYFPVVTASGELKEAFLAVVNTQPSDERLIAKNAERVVTARLRDARFFWEADRKTSLESRLDRLHTVLFHKKLGSYRDKAERIEKLAEWIAAEAFGQPGAARHAKEASRIAKADLTTDMVFEFPELQGTMGGIYAREEGLPEEVWKAIYYQYLPIGVEANAPPSKEALGLAAVPWAALTLADRLDTITGLFVAGEKVTGSRDPFALRRAAQAIVKILADRDQFVDRERITLGSLVDQALLGYGEKRPAAGVKDWSLNLSYFLIERVRHLLTVRGASFDEVEAVVPLDKSVDDVDPLTARRLVDAIRQAKTSPQFLTLAELFKRVKNISKDVTFQSDWTDLLTYANSGCQEEAERQLILRVAPEVHLIDEARKNGKYIDALNRLAAFQPLVERFFDEVMVMTDDEVTRRPRLQLMAGLRELVLSIADISEIIPQTE
jgi:glycyl-tRNA synthetase beta chain